MSCRFVAVWGGVPELTFRNAVEQLVGARVASHLRHDLRPLMDRDQAATIRQTLQSYMDGVWLNTAQNALAANPALARRDARAVLDLLLASDQSPRG